MKYFFVRILETCNARCGMCRFGGNRGGYQFPAEDWPTLLDSACAEGVHCVRLTGGEPLIHPDIVKLVAEASARGLRVSIITNGHRLEPLLPALVDGGLAQVIVSVDSADAAEHDTFRGIRGLHARALAGLRAARTCGLHTRVNTVCGPENFRGMPALQDLLTDLGVEQWELSTLKLERPLNYTPEDRDALERTTCAVYAVGPSAGKLRPFGKVWWGETPSEQDAYLTHGVAPRPTNACEVVGHVRYLDPATRRLYPCSLLPHRPNAACLSVPVAKWKALPLSSPEMTAIAEKLAHSGFRGCTACSTTAAGFHPRQTVDTEPFAWDY